MALAECPLYGRRRSLGLIGTHELMRADLGESWISLDRASHRKQGRGSARAPNHMTRQGAVHDLGVTPIF
jgi:hypothetical protein